MKKLVPKPLMTLANQITIVRIALIPVIVILLLENHPIWVLGLLGFCMATDALDGFVARKRKEQSRLGAFLDPLADKLLLTAIFLTFSFLDFIEMWVFVVIFSRDLLIVLGWVIIFILTGSSKIAPRILGKTTTAVQLCTALGIIAGVPDFFQVALIWITTAFTTASAVDYIIIGEKRLGEWT